jgi:hypothetical protein
LGCERDSSAERSLIVLVPARQICLVGEMRCVEVCPAPAAAGFFIALDDGSEASVQP